MPSDRGTLPTPSGKCPGCGYRVKLRANGTVGKHHLWQGRQYLYVCSGTGANPAEEPGHAS